MISNPRDGNGEVAANTFELDPFAPKKPIVQAPTASVGDAVVATKPPVAKATESSAPLSAKELLVSLRARLRDVKAEIRKRRSLERERDQLERLIRAAKEEKTNVRRLRAAG